MTVSSTVRTAGPFIGTGLVSAYPFAYKVFADTDVVVQTTDTSGNLLTLVLDSDYSVALNSDQNAAPGGTVNLAVALAAGASLTLGSNLPLTQPTVITNAGGFFPKIIENALDRLTIMIQQALTYVMGAIRVPEIGGVPPVPPIAQRKNTLFSWDEFGNPSSVVPSDQSASSVAIQLGNLIASLAASAGSSLVGFIQAGVNALARTVQAKLRETVSPTDYLTGTITTASIQAAHDYVETLANGGFVRFPTGAATVVMTAGIIWNPNKVGFDLNGCTLDFSALATGAAIKFRQTNGDANVRQALNRAHPISNGYLLGTGTVTGAVIAVDAQDNNPIDGGFWLPGVTFNNMAFFNFYRTFVFGNGAFLWTMNGGEIGGNSGTGFDASVLLLSTALNGGENIVFNNYYFGLPLAIRNQNGNSSLFFRGCSGDYNTNLLDCQAGYTDWDGYIENSTDTDYWVKVTGQNTYVRVSGTLVLTATTPKTAYEIFYCDASCTNGGIDLDVARFFGTVPYLIKLIGGTGRVEYRERGDYRTTSHPAIGGGTNLLRNGDFEGAALTDWTLSGATLPAISTTYARSGTHSLKFLASSTSTPGASTTMACKPGQGLNGELWYRVDAITGTAGTFFVTVVYVDAMGQAIASSAVAAITANVGSWTQSVLSTQIPAPMGTRNVIVSVSIFGTTSGAPAAYIDDVQLAVA